MIEEMQTQLARLHAHCKHHCRLEVGICTYMPGAKYTATCAEIGACSVDRPTATAAVDALIQRIAELDAKERAKRD